MRAKEMKTKIKPVMCIQVTDLTLLSLHLHLSAGIHVQ